MIILKPPTSSCDNSKDCSDNSDEIVGCSKDGLKCRNSDGEQIIIKKDYICDGVKDCFSGEDESPCGDKRVSRKGRTRALAKHILHVFKTLSIKRALKSPGPRIALIYVKKCGKPE